MVNFNSPMLFLTSLPTARLTSMLNFNNSMLTSLSSVNFNELFVNFNELKFDVNFAANFKVNFDAELQ